MLLFSNYVSEGSPYLKAAREAAGTIGAHLDVVGDKMGTSTPNPEKLLGSTTWCWPRDAPLWRPSPRAQR